MISIEALNSTKDLVALLADKGVTLRTRHGTPVAEAMSATPVFHQSIDCLTEIDKLPGSIYNPDANVKVVDGSEICVHSAYQDAAADALGIMLSGQVAFATSVVLPVIADLATTLTNALDVEQSEGVGSYKIEMVTGSSLLDLSEIVSSLDEYANISQTQELPFILDFKPLSDEQIVDLMKIGADGYDQAIAEFVSQATMPVIREVWDTVFGGNPNRVPNYDVFRSDSKLSEYRNFATFLIASRLMIDKDKLPEVTGESRMSAAKYPLALRELMEVSGAALYILLSRLRQREKTGLMIERIEGKRIFVNKAVYDRYMADGGDIEAILGAAISTGANTTLEQIVEGTEKYLDTWGYHVSNKKMAATDASLITGRVVISGFIHRFVQTTDDEVILKNRDLILSGLNSFLETIFVPSLQDIHSLATKTVCQVLFNHTDAEKILNGVTEAMQANPDITKEDALDLSMRAYVAYWFAEQIEIDQ